MKAIRVDSVREFDKVFYSGKMDPRLLVRLTNDIEVGETQDAQRPLEEKHLKEISEYVGEQKGILPGSVLISTKKNDAGKQLTVTSELCTIIRADGTQEQDYLCFMEIPETEEEIEAYKNTLNIIDGQHRIFSFRKDFCSADLKNSDVYEMTFSLFELPSIRDRQMLFMSTNEKQKAVSPNLLLYLRDLLGLLNDTEKQFLKVVQQLNQEDFSPLKGRIVMSAERVFKGYKSKEILKILKKTFPDNLLGKEDVQTVDQRVQAISRYLAGWESYYGLSFRQPQKDTMTKTAGLRYILWLFPLFWETAVEKDRALDKEYIYEMIENLKACVDDGDLFGNKNDFKGEGATDKAVKVLTAKCKEYILEQRKGKRSNPLR